MKKRTVLYVVVAVVLVLAVALVGGSFYMVDFSLHPDPTRANRDSCYEQLYTNYPETRPWVDSLQAVGALRDTFVVMPTGERHHAYFIKGRTPKTAIVVHGWRDQAIKWFCLAQLYEQALGYSVVIPDLHACGASEGDAIGMGWNDRLDVRHWMQLFRADTMVVHGVSMGAATTMMLSGETMPEDIRDLRFVADCGYTSVWDEFAGQLHEQFGLPPFPLLYSSSLLCKLRYGWSFGEASALSQVSRCPYPMFFIHGDSDDFVPTAMVHRLYDAKKGVKQLWITSNTDHAHSYKNHRAEYTRRVRQFLIKQ